MFCRICVSGVLIFIGAVMNGNFGVQWKSTSRSFSFHSEPLFGLSGTHSPALGSWGRTHRHALLEASQVFSHIVGCNRIEAVCTYNMKPKVKVKVYRCLAIHTCKAEVFAHVNASRSRSRLKHVEVPSLFCLGEATAVHLVPQGGGVREDGEGLCQGPPVAGGAVHVGGVSVGRTGHAGFARGLRRVCVEYVCAVCMRVSCV